VHWRKLAPRGLGELNSALRPSRPFQAAPPGPPTSLQLDAPDMRAVVQLWAIGRNQDGSRERSVSAGVHRPPTHGHLRPRRLPVHCMFHSTA
jgi:hypothetical protein